MKPVLAETLWVFLFFFLVISEFSVCIRICRESDQQALETLKKEAYDPDNILSSWMVGKDCCEWKGVVCHNLTGHVIELRIYVEPGELRISNLEWLPSLVNLKHLQMDFVDLSKVTNWLQDNNLIGGIPQSIEVLSNLKSLNFRRNSLTGPLPLSLGNCTNLRKLDLAENEIVGELPPWFGRRLSQLIILSLRSNKFHGELPQEICNLKDLQILDIANNSFVGIIPLCIDNFTTMVTGEKGGVVNNALQYYFFGVGVTENAMVTTKGNTYMYDTILKLVTSMDMSDNNLSGDIPTSLTNLVGLRFCNFSNNHLSGRIPNDIGNMNVLESFDLSENQLSGQIPQSLASLSTLSVLNLSNNNLSGKIPLSTQLQSFDPSSFEGNKNLCGLPLLKDCSSDGQTPNLDENEEEESDEDEWDGFYISMAIGFVLCFYGVGGSLILKRSRRHPYYRFLNNSWNSLRAKLHRK